MTFGEVIILYAKEKTSHQYDDIIELPHHQSTVRPRMSRTNRAAQFAPFAALTGYEAAIMEMGRQTDARIDLDENRQVLLDEKLQALSAHLGDQPAATITFFEPDKKKAGGVYRIATGTIRKMDEYSRQILFSDGTVIPIDQIIEVESPLFEFLGGFDV